MLEALATNPEAQVIYATHSPLVAAIPGAQILELNDDGLMERKWEELQMVSLWRSFLARPEKFFDSELG